MSRSTGWQADRQPVTVVDDFDFTGETQQFVNGWNCLLLKYSCGLVRLASHRRDLRSADLAVLIRHYHRVVHDLAGEAQWIRRMIDEHHDAATESGARIVHCCGFDSVPMDIGVWFLQQEAMRRYGSYCTSIAMLVKAIRGGPSGGTPVAKNWPTITGKSFAQ